MDKYEILRELGEGKFGAVCLARDTGTDALVAIKKTRQSEVTREFKIHSGLEHPNVLKLVERIGRRLVLEYAPMELFDVLKDRGFLHESTACRYFLDVCRGLEYLHSMHVMHRDIKPENLLISEDGVVKIADFGLAKRSTRDRARTVCGTDEYLPPEMIREVPYDHRVDIWSTGVLLYEMLVGDSPFASNKGRKRVHHKILVGKVTFPEWIPSELRDVIMSFLQVRPDDRATLRTVLEDMWVHATSLGQDSDSDDSDDDSDGSWDTLDSDDSDDHE